MDHRIFALAPPFLVADKGIKEGGDYPSLGEAMQNESKSSGEDRR